jgi:hypothetical protein
MSENIKPELEKICRFEARENNLLTITPHDDQWQLQREEFSAKMYQSNPVYVLYDLRNCHRCLETTLGLTVYAMHRYREYAKQGEVRLQLFVNAEEKFIWRFRASRLLQLFPTIYNPDKSYDENLKTGMDVMEKIYQFRKQRSEHHEDEFMKPDEYMDLVKKINNGYFTS